MKPREVWIGKGDPGEDRVFKTRSEAHGYSNIATHYREVLPSLPDMVTITREQMMKLWIGQAGNGHCPGCDFETIMSLLFGPTASTITSDQERKT